MQSSSTIQHAHDILVQVLLRQTPLRLKPEDECLMLESARVLCWVLHEDGNPHVGQSFSADFQRLEDELLSPRHIL